ncbi:MAG: apolipoprotein N-acyltransferase [Gemmatimonadaceae bacterium]
MRRPSWLPIRDEALPAFASAALFLISFPPFRLLLPVFVMLIPVTVAVARKIERREPSRTSFRLGFWFGAMAYGITLYWIAIALSIYTKLSFLGYIGAVLVMAPVVGAAIAALHVIRRATRWPFAILLPVVWTASEIFINYMSDLAFPWLPLGLATTRFATFAQIADLSGVRGVSFWIAGTSGLLADAWLLRADRREVVLRVGAVVAIAATVAAYGQWRLRSIALEPVAPIAIVQPNIPQEEKWQAENRDRIVGMLASLTRQGVRSGDPELIVWPEVALPGYLVQNPQWSDTLRTLSGTSGVPILFGVIDVEFSSTSAPGQPQDYDLYNAAMSTDSAGALAPLGPYRKEFLVPVVERVPFLDPDWFKGLRYFGGFQRGKDQPPFRYTFGDAGILICYESIFPQLSREYRQNGAEILINITNDAWFGRSIAPYQHEAHLALRAIENRVGIVRSANTGVSAYVDPLGRFHGETALETSASRTYQAHTTSVMTVYVRIGDWVGVGSLLATTALVVLARVRRRRE